MKGKVKFFNAEKGFGFITSDDDGKDYFVHRSDLPEGTEELADEAEVEFEVVEGPKGPKAGNVVLA